MEYLRRHLDDSLDSLVGHLPALAIEGPKGCGKTETALRRADVVYSLDDPATCEEVKHDPSLVTRGKGVIFIDEWQRVPSVWDAVRRAVDRQSHATFILAGSAMPPRDAAIHSGAGRIVTMQMRPLSFPERQIAETTVNFDTLLSGVDTISGECPLSTDDYDQEALRSGFPGIRPLPDFAREQLLSSYVDRIVQRELHDAGVSVRRPDALRAWLRAYAAASGTTAKYNAIMEAATTGEGQSLDQKTARAYRTALIQLFILQPVEGWWPSNNPLKRLSVAPKHFIADAGLLAFLLQQFSPRYDGQPTAQVGAIFETLVASTLASLAQKSRSILRHIRTHSGTHEVDFIIERPDGRVLAVEVKRSAHIVTKDVRHLIWLREQLGPRWAGGVVISTGKRAYTRDDGIHIAPLGLLG